MIDDVKAGLSGRRNRQRNGSKLKEVSIGRRVLVSAVSALAVIVFVSLTFTTVMSGAAALALATFVVRQAASIRALRRRIADLQKEVQIVGTDVVAIQGSARALKEVLARVDSQNRAEQYLDPAQRAVMKVLKRIAEACDRLVPAAETSAIGRACSAHALTRPFDNALLVCVGEGTQISRGGERYHLKNQRLKQAFLPDWRSPVLLAAPSTPESADTDAAVRTIEVEVARNDPEGAAVDVSLASPELSGDAVQSGFKTVCHGVDDLSHNSMNGNGSDAKARHRVPWLYGRPQGPQG